MDGNRDVRINEDFSWNFLTGCYMSQRKYCHPTKCITRTKRTILHTPTPRKSKVHNYFCNTKENSVGDGNFLYKAPASTIAVLPYERKVQMNNLDKPVKL